VSEWGGCEERLSSQTGQQAYHCSVTAVTAERWGRLLEVSAGRPRSLAVEEAYIYSAAEDACCGKEAYIYSVAEDACCDKEAYIYSLHDEVTSIASLLCPRADSGRTGSRTQ
jgi:hypothetical protein